MYKDANLWLSGDGAALQAITDSSAASTSYIDMLAAGDAIGPGAMVEFRVKKAFAGGTSIAFDLRTDTTSGFSTDTVLFSTGAIAEASLTANKVIARVVIPMNAKRYLRGYYTTVGTHSTGTIEAVIILDGDKTLDGTL